MLKILISFTSLKPRYFAHRFDHSGIMEPIALRRGQSGHSLRNVPRGKRVFGLHCVFWGQRTGLSHDDVLFGVYQPSSDQMAFL